MIIKSLQLKRALRSVLLVLLLSAVGMGKMDAQNLIVNPDFESGNTGFFSDYQYMTTGSVDAGQYCVDVNSTGHGVGMVGWPTILGYGGSGNYMLVNGFGGNTNPTKAAWKQTVTVTPNTDYIFSCQVVNLAQSVFGYSPNPAILRLKINGSTVGGDYTVAQNNSWHEWSVSWHNGNATQAEIAIYDVYTGDSGLGDDFGLDHLSLTPQATFSVNAVDDDVPLCVEYYQTYQIDVLANDIITPSSQMSGATVQVIQAPAHGNASWNNNTHKINYTFMDQGYYGGLDQFKYRVTIPHGESSDAWVYVNTGRTPDVGWIDTPGPICAGGSLGISVPSVQPDQGSGQWVCSQTQNGTFSPFDSNNVPLSMNGWYVKYKAINDCGDGYSNTMQITVIDAPSIGTIQAPPAISAGGSFNLTQPTVQSNGSPIFSQGWQIAATQNGNYSPFDNNNVPYSYNGYWIRYFADSECGEAYSNAVQITVYQDDNNITFADANVKAICVANWDTNEDGELSYDEAAAVTDLGQVFRGNTTITSFEELQYFTGLATISDYAFYSCSNLSGSLFIPNSVTTIGDYAFMGCQQITGCLTIPNSVTTIGNYAFAFCHLLSGSLTIPNSVITIGELAFSNCQGFTGSLTIGNSVTTIARAAFIGCIGFTGSLTIPNSVTSIGYEAFYNCSGLAEVYYNAINCADVPLSPFIGCSGLLSIGESVERIPAHMFQDCNGFTGSLTIPNSVTSIGYRAFENCTGFSGVIFNATNCADFYKYYIYSPFNGCIGSFTIGESVERIPAYMFKGCNGFTGSLTIPNSVTSIGEDAFKNCSGFTGLIYNATNCADVNYSYSSYSPFNGCVGSLIIGENVERIPAYMFKGCNGFTGGLTIPNSVTMIGDWAFYDCSGMTSLTISNSVITMGNDAFMNCSGFTGNVTIPDSLTEIGHSVFRGCSGLASLTLPNALTSIGVSAFYGCSGLTSLYIPNSVTSIGEAAFSACSNLEQIIVGLDNVVYDSRENCNGIIQTNTNELMVGCKNTIIPNSVSSIGYYAFLYCTNLISIIIPDSVTTIGDYAFNGCSGLTSMTVLAETPPALGSDAFYDVNTSIPVYVPCSSLSAYQSAVGWNEFTNYMPATTCASGEITVTANPTEGGTVTGAGYYEGGVTCTLTATPNESFSFLNWMENGVIVSNDTVYSFIVSGDRDLVANFAEEGDVCTLTFDLFDSYGDGYTGNYLVVTDENGFSQQLTVESGSSAVYTLPFLTGSHITLTWIVGSYPEDCSFTVSYSNGYVIYHCENLNESFSYEFDVDCVFSPMDNIIFADTNVKAICVANWDTNGDGELSYAEAAAVTDLGQVFRGNTEITSFEELRDFVGLNSIGDYEFFNCHGLTSIEIPNSVISIGIGAFRNCSSMARMVVESGNTVYDSRGNCNSIIKTSTNELVAGCKTTVIPDSVTSIGNDAFYFCSGLTSIEIPNTVISIGSLAFEGCTGLTSIEIPNSVTSIERGAFWGCSNLTDIVMLGTIPPSFGSDVYIYTNNCPIYVPYESVNDYKTTTNWSDYEDRIFPMSYTTIPGYGEGEGNYRFIASPLVENTTPTAVDNMITETAYDLYRFDQSEEAEWQNYKYPENTPNFFLTNGQGYLYAIAEDVNLIFKGEFNEDDTKEVDLAYDVNAEFAGWNLVGNPFPVNAYANKSYYTMNEEGSAIEPNMVSSATAIPACTGVMVMAESEGETVVFSTEAPEAATNQGCLQIAVAQTNERGTSTGSVTALDKAILSFNAGDRLEKFVFNMENAVISIPQGGKDFAIACTDKQGKMPLNFKATKNGEYTLTIHPEAVELDYLHLIDNLTGADVDLLVSPAYTFTAKTTDYASRFRLVFSGNEADGPSTSSGTFAFISNGNIIITDGPSTGSGACILQIVDMQGHIIVSTDAARNVSTCGIVPGVYVLRLINGDDVKTQKIVVR